MPKKTKKPTTATTTKQSTMSAKQSTIPEMRLPDLVLRQILSHLEFPDIKNCRLVSTQWHRHALDNVNFALIIEYQRQSADQQRGPTNDDSPFKAQLIPFSAIPRGRLAERDQVKAVRRPGCKWIDFYRLRGDVRAAFEPKIRQIKLKVRNCNGDLLHRLILTCLGDFAAANYIDGKRSDVDLRFSFEREWLREGRSTMKLRELQCPLPNWLSANAAQSIITPFFCHAANVRMLHACEMERFEELLTDFERVDNNNQPLYFPACEHLALQWSGGTFAPFNKFSGCFYNVNKISMFIFNEIHQIDADICTRLLQLANLKHLSIIQRSEDFLPLGPPLQLPELCLPNLVRLRLAGPQLSANPLYFDSSSLQELIIQGDFNIVPLAIHSRFGLKQLTTLELRSVSAENIDRYLPTILKATRRLQELKIKGAGFELATAVCIKAVEAKLQQLRLVEIGRVIIPPAVGRLQLVRELIAWHSLIGLNVPLFLGCDTLWFVDKLVLMARQQSEIDIDGTNVQLYNAPGNWTNVEMTWRNGSSGAQQKLVARWEFRNDTSEIEY